MPCARFHIPPRATGEDAVGKLSTERARELAFVDRKPLEDLVVLSGKTKQNMNANIFCCSEIKTDFFIFEFTLRDSMYDLWQSTCRVCPQVWT